MAAARRKSKKRDVVALEKRRLEGAKLLKQGFNHSAIARELGVSRQAVIKWRLRLKKGKSRLKAQRLGRKPKLSDEQLTWLRTTIGRKPPMDLDPMRFNGRWTGTLLAILIEREFQIACDRFFGSKLLKRLKADACPLRV